MQRLKVPFPSTPNSRDAITLDRKRQTKLEYEIIAALNIRVARGAEEGPAEVDASPAAPCGIAVIP
jgi:hypothetical protein